ncbi:putative acetyltransferase [Yoonia maricola]|uniref:Putative acetyltransferase n=1 Tax=Yoonia maricola TaxID=420999 RepID=A0A2M8W540_9RHOB|nr:N-acetyltransferase [Yoonia maricola]PJI86042.1 putative acetyltransferase [Yoonia maricola]
MIIRLETDADHQAIYALTRDAFAPMSFSDGSEPDIVNQLREDGDLTLSLVADQDGIIGHVAFSPAKISNAEGAWYGLGPISVRADRQRQGLGSKLAHTGLDMLRKLGAAGCVLTGNPDVYRPMGFSNDHALTYSGLNPKYILFISFDGTVPKGEINFAEALEEDHP